MWQSQIELVILSRVCNWGLELGDWEIGNSIRDRNWRLGLGIEDVDGDYGSGLEIEIGYWD